MKFNTNKEKGNTGLGIAIAYYTANGYIVSVPLNDTQDYDLIVDKNNKIFKVQVKATSCKTKYEIYQVALKSCGGTKGKTYKTIVKTNIDEIFIVTDNIDIYIIPIEKINNYSTLNLCEKYINYKVKKKNCNKNVIQIRLTLKYNKYIIIMISIQKKNKRGVK